MDQMDNNQVAIYFLNNAKRIEKKTGYAYARNGVKLRALFPERELKEAMTAKYGLSL